MNELAKERERLNKERQEQQRKEHEEKILNQLIKAQQELLNEPQRTSQPHSQQPTED